jgi:hypothetical protein
MKIKKRKTAVLFLGVLCFLAGSAYMISVPLQFLVYPTGLVKGKYTNFSPQPPYRSSVKYTYTVNGILYNGDTDVYVINFIDKKNISVRYLEGNPSISIIESAILSELIINLLIGLSVLYMFLYAIIGLLGKLPAKLQAAFNSRMRTS